MMVACAGEAGEGGVGWQGTSRGRRQGGRRAGEGQPDTGRRRTLRRWEVEVAALPYMARGHKLSPLFRLVFRRASLQHPLLAGALGEHSTAPLGGAEAG